jgi:hypothetical protein
LLSELVLAILLASVVGNMVWLPPLPYLPMHPMDKVELSATRLAAYRFLSLSLGTLDFGLHVDIPPFAFRAATRT